MVDLAGFSIRRMFSAALWRDGQADTVEAAALQAGEELAASAAVPGASAGRTHRAVAHPQTIIAAAMAQKLLHGWMQNRYQTRYPLVLNFRNNSPAEAALLTQVIHYALRSTDASAEAIQQARAWVEGVGGTLGPPENNGETEMIARLHAERLAPQAYAACVGALGRRAVAHRRFLDFLAARLGLADDVARSLNRRFAS